MDGSRAAHRTRNQNVVTRWQPTVKPQTSSAMPDQHATPKFNLELINGVVEPNDSEIQPYNLAEFLGINLK